MAGYTHFGMSHLRGFGGDIDRTLDHAGDFEPNRPVMFTGRLDGGIKWACVHKNISGSTMNQGSLASRHGTGVTSVDNITSGTTTSITTTGLTAGSMDGGIIYVHDDNSGAGGGIESEASLIKKNTATVITIDSDYPLAAAPAVNDDFRVITITAVASTAANKSWHVLGVVLSPDGIPDDEFGWFQFFGPCYKVLTANVTIALEHPVEAGAGVVDQLDNDGLFDEIVGQSMFNKTDVASLDQIPVRLTCSHLAHNFSDLDAVAAA